jgi:DNA-binding Lrp family transcriptional regulator
MLHRFLKEIQAGDVQSLLEIARKMGISPDLVLQMADELTHAGYLKEIGADCEGSEKGCPDCPINPTCQVIVRQWFLTEKGRAAVANVEMTK